MRVVPVLVAIGVLGCGDSARERPAPVAIEVRIVSGPSGLVRDPRPSWAFEVRGAPAGVECAIDGTAAAPCRDEFTPAADLAEGPHAFTVRATGAAGDQSSDSRMIRVDAAAPAIALRAPLVARRTSAPRPAVSFAVDDASQVAVTCSLDGGPAVACDTRFAAAADLPEGQGSAAGSRSQLGRAVPGSFTSRRREVTDSPSKIVAMRSRVIASRAPGSTRSL
jgi:hypothetical protein